MGYYLLDYEYVDDYPLARTPYREAHLAAVREATESGTLRLAGATMEAPYSAIFVFSVDEPELVERFVAQDAYTEAGIVIQWRIRAWHPVVGAEVIT
ncbi:MAG: hypothetical protein ABJA86_11370 [Nocardioidaceae bacterium]